MQLKRTHIILAGLTLAVLGALGACAVSQPPLQAEGKPYHHLADGTFRNPPGSPASEAGFAEFFPFMLGRIASSFDPPVPPPGHALPPEAAREGMVRHANSDRVTWLGHATMLLKLNGATILTDPFLTDYAGPLRNIGPKRYVPPALQPHELPALDIIVVSHNHYDHLDAGTIEAITGKEKLTVVVPLRLGAFFRDRGYTDVVELDWYESVERKGVKVTAVPAVHFSRRGAFDKNRTLWSGYVFEGNGKRAYFAGDTGYGPVFKEAGSRFAPVDLALIPIGAYEPRVIMEAHHVTPKESIGMARDFGAKHMIGMHWGTILLTEEPPFEAPERMAEAAANAGQAASVLKIGETRPF